ncbi:methionine aminopeptidase [Wilcoxina mikolae CBS 423.85]|nr:methionine aminopeptidase [Wilcoxina mikolae CBS 423.85]
MSTTTATNTLTKKFCAGVACANAAGTLQCPTCLKLGNAKSFFCSQDCFKRSWSDHKSLHKPAAQTGTHNPFPDFQYTGALRPHYPLSNTRKLPEHIPRPDYALDGIPRSEYAMGSGMRKIAILNEEEMEGMRTVCRLAREVLDIAATAIAPGVTTNEIDEIVHKACIERDSYPSPLNYSQFPKSVCTSINEIICHGIPDQRPLKEGDIVNIDVTLYHKGFHGDLNETYYVGKPSPEAIRVVETARDCLDAAIAQVKPGMAFRDPGNVIEPLAKSRGCSVVRTYCGHGINQLFHGPPNVPHYAKNKAVGIAKKGMCFTIEPMVNLGSCRDKTWPDEWTSTTVDGKLSAQFEHTLLVTDDGVEVLTARKADSPGGPVPIPEEELKAVAARK